MRKPLAVRGAAFIEIPVASAEVAQNLRKALLPETINSPSDRALTSVEIGDSSLILKIEANDLTAMRAAINSFLSWISGSLKTLDSVLSQKS